MGVKESSNSVRLKRLADADLIKASKKELYQSVFNFADAMRMIELIRLGQLSPDVTPVGPLETWAHLLAEATAQQLGRTATRS